MSPALAIVLLCLGFAVALLPLALAWRGVVRGAPVAIGYGAITLGMVAYQLGIGGSSPIRAVDTNAARQTNLSPAQCGRILQTLDEARVIVDRRNPARLVVVRALWEQLPRQAQEATLICAGRGQTGADPGALPEVVFQ